MARFGAKRPQQVREPLPIVVVVCDDSKTAPAYLSEVRARLKEHCTIKAIPVPKSPGAVIDVACNQRADLTDDGKGATVWVMIDLEMNPDSSTLANTLRQQAKDCGVELLLSQPCFEVWVLAHFVNTGQSFASCEAVISEVKKQWKAAFGQEFPQKKAQADYRKLMDRMQAAISNAKTHTAAKSQSWTEVWRVIEHVHAFATI